MQPEIPLKHDERDQGAYFPGNSKAVFLHELQQTENHKLHVPMRQLAFLSQNTDFCQFSILRITSQKLNSLL